MDFLSINRAFQEFLLQFQFKGFWEQLQENIQADSFFPELERKSRAVRVLDNLGWYFRNGEMNRYYNSYGFDIKGLRNQREYLARNRFRQQRNDLNLKVTAFGYTLICLLRDKIAFSAYLSKCLGAQYVPADLGLTRRDGSVIVWDGGRSIVYPDLSAFLENREEDLFIKRLTGECGEGCYLLEGLTPGTHFCQINGTPTEFRALAADIIGSEYIIQRRLVQHEALSRINPSCVNTVRIITIIGQQSQEPRIFAHFLRLGVNSPVDNRATGGMAVRIDEDGMLRGNGISHQGQYKRHPVTEFEFEGYHLPFWSELKQLVIDAHLVLKHIPTIGWDVAITPDGPVLVEANDNWEICGVQDTYGGVKKRWLEFIRQ